jgi:DNA-binding transcriptional LysR family regulator
VAFQQLKLFRDIAQTRSVSRGAQLNGISQSAASQHIHELERLLDARLLDRSTRPLTLTPAGNLYLGLCREVLRRNEEFMAALGGLKQDVQGTVRVASIYSIALSEMSLLENEFARRHPGARLSVEYLRPDKVLEAVLADRADLGLISYPAHRKDLAVLPWRTEEMVLATSPSHPLASARKVTPADLEGQDFIAFDEDLPIRHDIDRYLREYGVRVNLVMHFEVVEMMKEAVAFGSGISILPRRIMQSDIERGRIAAIPLDPGLSRPLGIIHRKRKRFNPATQAFLEVLKEPARDFTPVR